MPPTQRDISLYTCLTQELENYYKVNGIFDAGMLGKQQQLLDDLIRPKQNSPEYFHDRCAQLNIPYQGTFRIGLVQCESSTLFKVSHISNQLRAHCPLANYGVFQYGSPSSSSSATGTTQTCARSPAFPRTGTPC